MKLRTRITVAMMGITALAITIGMGAMIYRTYQVSEQTAYDSVLGEAKSYVYQYNNIESRNAHNILGGNERAIAKYALMKLNSLKYEGSEYVIQDKEGDIFNNSGIDPRATLDKYGTDADLEDGERDFKNVIIKWHGKYYCVVGTEYSYADQYEYMSVVRDITDSMEQMIYLTYFCILIGVIILFIAALGIYFFLKWQFAPLRKLEKQADSIAGKYSNENIQASVKKSGDEIKSLSLAFTQMQNIVDEYIEKVEANAKEQKLLLSAMAHEMRTPITAITGYSYMLKNVALKEEQREEAIDFIDSESKRLERLSTKLNELITIENKSIQPVEIDWDEWRNRLDSILKNKAEEHQITYSIISDGEESIHIKGDEDLLTELIINLFDNAIKAGATHIEIKTSDDSISVTDNGSGIADDEIEKIMQPFYQADASRKGEGFGIGLALCQLIARAHGAQIEVESQVGVGSTFMLIFTTSLHFDDDSKMSPAIS